MKRAYLRQYDSVFPNLQDADGNSLAMICGRIGPIPPHDGDGNPVQSETILVEAEQEIHDILFEMVGYEQLASLEEIDAQV